MPWWILYGHSRFHGPRVSSQVQLATFDGRLSNRGIYHPGSAIWFPKKTPEVLWGANKKTLGLLYLDPKNIPKHRTSGGIWKTRVKQPYQVNIPILDLVIQVIFYGLGDVGWCFMNFTIWFITMYFFQAFFYSKSKKPDRKGRQTKKTQQKTYVYLKTWRWFVFVCFCWIKDGTIWK